MDVAMNAQAVMVENGLETHLSSFHGLWSLGAMFGGSDCDFCSDAGFYTSPTCSIFILDLTVILGLSSFLMIPSVQEEKGEKTRPLYW